MNIALIETVAQISSVFSLAAFLGLLYYFYKRAILSRELKLIRELKSDEKSKIVDKTLTKSRVNISGLTKEQKYDIAVRELENERYRAVKNQQTAISIAILLLLALGISSFVANRSEDMKTNVIKCFKDVDGDGFGNPNIIYESLEECPPNYVSNGDDTDDSDPLRYKGEKIWYEDDDLDGYGTPKNSKFAVVQPRGFVSNSEDVDDKNKNRNIQALEKEWYEDKDGDGFGNTEKSVKSIPQPSGYVLKNGDCDDGDKNVFPGQYVFFDIPSRSTKVWDFNCDGRIELKYTQIGRCDGGRANPQGWVGSIPNAGQNGTWLMDCDRKMRGFPPKFEVRRETKPLKQSSR